MEETQNLGKSLRYIQKRFGKETFLDDKKMFSMLKDLNPKQSREINWVIESINSGAIKILVDSKNSENSIKKSKKIAKEILEENEINLDRIEYLLNIFYYGLGWSEENLSIDEIKEKNKNKTKENKKDYSSQKNKTLQTIKSSDEILEENKSNNQKIKKIKDLYTDIFNKVKNDETIRLNYIDNNKSGSSISTGILNIIVCMLSLSIIYCFASLFEQGYIYNYILMLDAFALILCIILLKRSFSNLRYIKIYINKKRIYKKTKRLSNDIEFEKKKIENGSILKVKHYEDANTFLVKKDLEIESLRDKWYKEIRIKTNKYNVKFLSVLVILIFIVSSFYETRLIDDYSTPINKLAKEVILGINDSVLDEKMKNLYVKLDVANVRNKPNLDGNIIKKVKEGDILLASGMEKEDKEGDTWYRIVLEDESTGWIKESTVNAIPQEVYVSTEAANIRSKPSLEASVVKIVKYGEALKTTGKAKERQGRVWFEVYVDGHSGNWISSRVLN